MNKAQSTEPRFRVNPRPAGDFAVQRFVGDRIQRWGVYETREEANDKARFANAALAATPSLNTQLSTLNSGAA